MTRSVLLADVMLLRHLGRSEDVLLLCIHAQTLDERPLECVSPGRANRVAPHPVSRRFVSLRRMAIVTKRNAVVGWITLRYGKKVVRIVVREEARQIKQKLPFGRKRVK
jgi:hypothetical protein